MHSEIEQPDPPRTTAGVIHWPFTLILLTAITLVTALAALYLAPLLALRWRAMEDHAAAESAYLRRQAELKAEVEAAERSLARIDDRFQLVSLGFREVARMVRPIVVNLSNEVESTRTPTGRTFFDFEHNRTFVEQAEGSGLLVTPTVILTNRHVVRDAERIRVTFANGRWLTVGAQAIATDALTDLAILRLPEAEARQAHGLDFSTQAVFADSDKDVHVGDWVLAVGSPFGLHQTVTAGIISAKGRVELGILDQVELLQTDAAINPGNSGGPLFNQHGRVIGINVAIASKTGRNQGVAFAIPSNVIKDVMEQLLARGEVVRGFVGILMQEVPTGLEAKLGLLESGGVIISDVSPNTPGEVAGLRRGDIVVGFKGEPVGTANPLSRLRHGIAHAPPDTTIPLDILRGGKKLTIPVTVARRPSSD